MKKVFLLILVISTLAVASQLEIFPLLVSGLSSKIPHGFFP